jgi:O-antigen/teichoic acid export membrane protein
MNHLRSLNIIESFRFLLSDTIIYGGASAISKVFVLITLPFVARSLTVTEFGTLDFMLTMANLLAVGIIFGQDSAVARYFYEFDGLHDRSQLISQSLIYHLVVSIVILPTLWYLFNVIELDDRSIFPPQTKSLFCIVLMQIPFLVINNFTQGILKWTFERSKYLWLTIGSTLVYSVSTLVGVIFFDWNINGVLLAGLSVNLLFSLCGLYFIRKWLAVPRAWRHLKEVILFAVPYGVICLCGAFMPILERSLIVKILAPEQLGLYAAGAKIALIVGLVVGAFQTAWGPFSLAIYTRNDSSEIYNLILKIFSVGLNIVVLILCLISPLLITLLFSDRYAGAEIVVFPLCIALAIQATGWLTELGIMISKRSYLNMYGYLVFVFVSIIGIVSLAPVYGIVGVACAVAVGQTAKSICSSWFAQRAYPLPWEYLPVIIIFCYTLLVYIVSECIEEKFGGYLRSILYIIGIFGLIILCWYYVLSKNERAMLLKSGLR